MSISEIIKKYNALRPSYPRLNEFEQCTLSRVGGVYVYDLGNAAFVVDETGNVFEVHGGIYDRWMSEGGISGRLGAPVTDEEDFVGADARPGDRISRFRNGCIVYRADTWQTEVQGMDKSGSLDSPKGDEESDALAIVEDIQRKYDALRPSYPRIAEFEQGTLSLRGGIYVYDLGNAAFVADENGDVYEVHGGIYDRWMSEGGINGELGAPVTDEEDFVGSDARPGDRISRFRNGCIVYRADTWQTEVRDNDKSGPSDCEDDGNTLGVLVDVGGSGVKIGWYRVGAFSSDTNMFHPQNREEFYDCILQVAKHAQNSMRPSIAGIAISLAGECDYVNDTVLRCWSHPFLTGQLKKDLMDRFDCDNVHIVNDGDAHALALAVLARKVGENFGCAVNLSLGTAVGFGMLDWQGNLIHTCQGHNWEVSNWEIDTSESNKQLFSALGHQGLKSLEKRYGEQSYIYYGERICHFLAGALVPVFHPRHIGLSGGIIAGHIKDIQEGIDRECAERGYRVPGRPLHGVDIYLSPEKDSVMKGLATLLYPRPSALQVGKIMDCTLVGVHTGKTVFVGNDGKDPLFANHRSLGWEPFELLTLVRNIDGSFAMKLVANGKYVSAFPNEDGRLYAQAKEVDLWEKFDLAEVSGQPGVFTLRSRVTGKYVSVDENNGNMLFANRDVADRWEWFRFQKKSGGRGG